MDIKRGDIWYVGGGHNTGSEQRAGRPAVIVSNEKNNTFSSTVEVVYLTTQPKTDLPTHTVIHSLGKDSTAICEQITTVAIERLENYRGRVTDEEMTAIERAIAVSLDLSLEKADDTAEDLLVSKISNSEDNVLAARVVEAEAKYALLQKLYDSMLNKICNRK